MVPVSGEREPIVRRYDWTDAPPSVAVIDAVARYEAVATSVMAERLTPLGLTLDTDALDTLIGDTPSSSFSFEWADYYIRISGETVAVSQPPAPHPDRLEGQ